MSNDDKAREDFEKLLDNDGSIDSLLVFKDGKYTNLFIQYRFNFYMHGRQSMKDECVVPMQELFTQLDNYLSKSNSECIGSGSIFHREIQEILIAIKQLKEQP